MRLPTLTASVVALALGLSTGSGQTPTTAPKTDLHGDPLPEGTVMRLGTVGFRVPNVAGVGFRKTGELVAFTENLELYEWPTDGSRKPKITRMPGDYKNGWRRAISADARFAAGFETRQVVVWDVSGEKPVEYLTHDANDVYQIAFSANGAWLAVNHTSGRQGGLLLCDLSAKKWTTVPGINGYFESLNFTPDGKSLAVATDRDVRVIDSATATDRCRITIPRMRPQFATLSPDGTTLAITPMMWVHGPKERVRLHSIPSGEEVAGLNLPPAPGTWARFLPDGKSLLLRSGDRLLEWDHVAGKLIHEVAGPHGFTIVYSPDSRRIASHSCSAVFLVDLAKGKHVRPDLAGAGHLECIDGFTFSPDGKLIATNSDREIWMWDAATGRPLFHVPCRSGFGPCLVFLPDSKSFISVAEFVVPVLRDVATGKELRRFTVPPEAAKSETTNNLRLSTDGKTLTTDSDPVRSGDKLYTVRWDVGGGKVIDRTERVEELRAFDRPVTSPDGKWIVRGIKLSRVGRVESIPLAPGGESYYTNAKFSDDSRHVAVPRISRAALVGKSDEGSLVVYDIEGRGKLTELPTGHVMRQAFSPDGRYIAVIGRKEIVVWDVLGAKAVRRFATEHGNSIRRDAMTFSPDGRRLVTGHDDTTALVWDLSGAGRTATAKVAPLSPPDLSRLWDELAGSDADKAYAAGWQLVDRPAQAVALVRERLKPTRAADGATVRGLLAKLDAKGFADREAAVKGVADLGESAVPALRAALKASPSAEQTARIERLLIELTAPVAPTGGRLRELRAVTVLERAGTEEARTLLKELAAGLDGARLTTEAAAAAARVRPPK